MNVFKEEHQKQKMHLSRTFLTNHLIGNNPNGSQLNSSNRSSNPDDKLDTQISQPHLGPEAPHLNQMSPLDIEMIDQYLKAKAKHKLKQKEATKLPKIAR